MLNHARRATLALTTSALMTAGLATAPAAQAAPADITPQAASAASWLASQLDDGLVISEYYSGTEWVGYTDYGLTLDFFYAFDGLGVKREVRKEILGAIEDEVEGYVTPFGTTYAGAVGKLLAAVQAQGIDPSTYGDGNLVSQLEGMVHTADDSELGRAEDSPSDDETDTSNTLGQSFVVRALSGADSDLADEALGFLLQQQCDDGFFRVYMESADHTCDGGTAEQSGASVDATATAVLALLEVQDAGVAGVDEAALAAAIADARKWLSNQQATNGSFTDEDVANSNSTGLAAQALAELGRTKAAQRAATWLASLRVTKKLVRRTAFAPRDLGAVAFSKAALAEGRTDGISRDARYQWRRSTAQAAVGLDSLAP